MRFTLALLFAVACTVSAKTLHHQLDGYSFEDYVSEYGKNYNNEEYQIRKVIFHENLTKIKHHNNNKHHSFKKGINHLTDQTKEEYTRLLGYDKNHSFRSQKKSLKQTHTVSSKQLPKSVDWRQSGKYVTPVKDQGQCGSCWSFGTAEVIESHYAIKHPGQIAVLSEQQILDCTANPNSCGGTGGCAGGTPELAYDQIKKDGGLSAEWTYPYTSYFGQDFPTCSFNSTRTRPVAVVTDYVVLPSNQEAPILDAVANKGPVVIAVDASEFHSYESGIFNACNSTNIDLNHAVVITGFGTDDVTGKDYWTVRNSWSPTWGEGGYIRIERTKDCGIDTTPGDGIGCAGGPSEVKTCGPCGLFYDVSYPIIQ